MKLIHATQALAAFAAVAFAQTQASDADVALVAQQIQNVVTAVGSLDQSVLAYTGQANTPALQSASNNVINVLNAGVAAINPIQGTISVTQGVTLLDPVNTLNSIVNKTVTDAIAAKPLFVASCVGPTILASLRQQLTASTALAQAIANKVDPSIRDFALSLAQPSIDSLNQAIQAYSDQTSLPLSCQPTSSAAATSSAIASTSTPATSVVVSTTSSAAASTRTSSGVVSTSTSRATTPGATTSSVLSTSSAASTSSPSSGSICRASITRSAALTTVTSTVTCADGQVTTTTVTLCRSACKHYPYVTTSTCPNGSVTTYTVTPSKQRGSSGVGTGTKPGSQSGTATVPAKTSYTGAAVSIAAEYNILALLGAAAIMAI